MLKFDIPARLDAVNAPDVEENLLQKINAEKDNTIICDFSNTTYISSAGLRVMLVLMKEMHRKGGTCTLTGMNDDIFGIFKMAGFDTIMNIER